MNLCLYQGDDFFASFNFADGTGAPIDLTGATARAQMRVTAEDSGVLADFDCVVAAAGRVDVHLDPAQTAALTGPGVWDLEMTYADGSVVTVIAGTVSVTPEVTR